MLNAFTPKTHCSSEANVLGYDKSMTMMQIEVLLFAAFREKIGQKSLSLKVEEGKRVREVALELEATYQCSLEGALCAVNEAYVEPDAVLQSGDTLAFFPAVSGGSGENHFFVTEDVLNLEHYFSLCAADAYGAQASFVGTVRSPNKGQVVASIDYQGYEAMMLTQMKVIAEILRSSFDLGVVVIAHRLGLLKPQEASVAIVISSPHRPDALKACAESIELIKERLPVWKLEQVVDTDSEEIKEHWVSGKSSVAETL